LAAAFAIDDTYSEDVRLQDGTRIRLRPVRSTDKGRLAEGLVNLSAESQHGRFFSLKAHFSPAELRYLTELDGINHFAIGAVECLGRRKEGAGVGIARFIRLTDEPEVAEAAVAVVDRLQNRGVGRLLLERLIAAALERGVRRFRSQVLAKNTRIRDMIAGAFPKARFTSHGAVVVVEFPLPERVTLSHGAPPRIRRHLSRILRLAAQRLVVFLPVFPTPGRSGHPGTHGEVNPSAGQGAGDDAGPGGDG